MNAYFRTEQLWRKSHVLRNDLQFLGLFGDVQSIKKAEDRHAKFFLPHRSMSELKKRHAEDFLASERAKMAKSYSGVPSSTQSLMGTYPSGQTPYPAGYGGQPQVWPPVTQAQTQQWNPGYGQQVDCCSFKLYSRVCLFLIHIALWEIVLNYVSYISTGFLGVLVLG